MLIILIIGIILIIFFTSLLSITKKETPKITHKKKTKNVVMKSEIPTVRAKIEDDKKQTSTSTKNKGGKKHKPRKRKTGFAETKPYTHTSTPHPCYYKKTGEDQVDYVTFTHSRTIPVENDSGEIIGVMKTKELTSNISKKERKKGKKTNVVPIVYQGKRSALGEEKYNFSLVPEDKEIVDIIFDSSPKKPAPKRKRQ